MRAHEPPPHFFLAGGPPERGFVGLVGFWACSSVTAASEWRSAASRALRTIMRPGERERRGEADAAIVTFRL